jgi:hypothetical protein
LDFSCKFCGQIFQSRRQVAGHEAGKHIKGPRLQNSTIRLDHLSEAQVGYLAAFLDGEGGIQITRTARKDREYTIALHPCVYFTNTNREVIETIRNWLGAGCIVTAKNKHANHKPSIILHVTGTKNIIELLTRLRPYLIIKAKQADTLISFCNSRASHYRGKERRYTDEELSLYTTLKRLNERGVKSNANARKSNEGGEMSNDTL